MQIFIASDTEILNGELNETESKHCVKVLRKRNGDLINITNGKGQFISATITDAHPKKCKFKIDSTEEVKKSTPELTIAIAPTKNMDRTEFFVEKCTEIGVSGFIPTKTFHSERKVLKTERLEKIIVAACKQSKNFHFPNLTQLMNFTDVIDLEFDNKFIAYCGDVEKVHFADLKLSGSTLILIGPEGDFSEDEVTKAFSKGFKTITLGESRLRTETAGIVACTIANLNYND
jgi:16S rRNA (uracil1498-N3)-methyltransferase